MTLSHPYEVEFLQSLSEIDYGDSFDFWSLQNAVGSMATVMVKPKQQEWFEESLRDRNIQYTISIMDLER